MRKVFIGIFAISIFVLSLDIVSAGRGCCSHHGGQAYCGDNGMWQCNDGTQSPTCGCSTYVPTRSTQSSKKSSYTAPSCLYGQQRIGGVCLSNEVACQIKYPGTTYQQVGDKCVCKNGRDYDSKKKKCL